MAVNRETILEELKSNPKVQSYIANYEESSVQSFLDHYATEKELLLNYGESYRSWKANDLMYYRNCAEKYYCQIAQKKLFNQQCLWRAQQIDLPIEVTYEFYYWSLNIKACPFIEKVTEREIEVMIDFLEKAPYDHSDNYLNNWQEYDDFKDEENLLSAGDNYPNWYAWYDVYIGPAGLMSLSDLRGAYEKKCFQAKRGKAIIPAPMPMPERKPWLSINQTEEFIKQVEPYQIIDYYRHYQEWSNKSERMEEMDTELKMIMEEQDEVWMPEGKFPDAIYHAAYLLKVKKIKSLLPQIHEEHLERLEMGISYEMEKDEFIDTSRQALREGKKILEGG